MLAVDTGLITHTRIHAARQLTIERGDMKIVRGIIVHQTGGATAASSLASYKSPRANGRTS